MTPFQSFIKNARSESGLTQLEFAEKLGFGRKAYIAWEQGARKPHRMTRCEIERRINLFLKRREVLK